MYDILKLNNIKYHENTIHNGIKYNTQQGI